MPPRRKVKRIATADATTGATTGDRNRISNKSEGKTTGARKLGGLKDMLEMPVDIISEITRHLHPRDLLSLSWSSKSLHKFFMRKGSKYMWKQSFQSLPWHLPIPEGIIEPAWATLLFTTVCTGCGTHTTDRDPIWEFNARFCVACATTKIIDSHDPLGDVLPRDKTHLAAHIPLAVFTPRLASFYHRATYLRSEMQEIIDKWDILLNLGDEDALAMFIGKCILRVQRAPMHIARCEAWSEAHAQAVIAENTALEDKYLKGIVSRLRELGWGDELDHMQTCNYAPLRQYTHFETYQELTDDVWQTIRDDMDQCMEQAREDRLVRERIHALQGRWAPLEVALNALSNLPEARAYNIGIGDIAVMPEIREIVDVPDDVSVDQASFADVHAKLGDMVERWKADGATKLRELIMRARPTLDQPKPKETKRKGKGKAKVQPEVDVLELATTRFHCSYCNDESVALYWPGVLAHACLRGVSYSEDDDAYKRFICQKMMSRQYNTAMLWNLDRLKVAEPSDAAKVVIQLCGKDPEVTTVEEMNALKVMLVRGDGEIRTWRNAILFDDTHRHMSKWRLAAPDQVAAAQERLPEIEMQRSRYICTSCLTTLWRDAWWYDDALQHLRLKHGLEFPTLDHKLLARKLAPDSLFVAGAIKMKLPNSR